MSTLTCEQTLTLITAARALPPRDCSAVTDHLAGCEECRMAAISCAEAVSLMERALARGSASAEAVALASHLVRCDRFVRQSDRRGFRTLHELPGEQQVRRDRYADDAGQQV